MRRQLPVLALACAVALIGPLTPRAVADTSGDKVRQAQQRAAALDRQARSATASAASAQSRLLDLSAAANAALAQAEATAHAVDVARSQAQAADAAEQAADAAADSAHQRIVDYARNAYIGGDANGRLAGVVSLLDSGSPTQLLDGLTLLDKVGGSMTDALAQLKVAQDDQSAAAAQAHIALAGLQRAEVAAAQARAAATRAVAAQRVLLADAKARAQAVAAQARQARQTARSLAAELAAEVAAARSRAAAGNAGARCEGGDISGYPNGRIPIALLCPLYGAPAEALRQDAAAQFNALSRAYESQFGSPICVADSYRSYERQQQIYAERPGYAATPGTSEHGWARAVDLCGGVETDGTPQNTWMRLNAAQYNWFHPGWADSGGGGPYEPWHWEYAG